MARGRNYNHRRRRGSFGFLYKLLSMLVICGAIIAALTLFFKVDSVSISGQERYSAEKIRDASGVVSGDNLILLDKYEIVNQIIKELPYIENIRITRKLPSTLVIEVEECGEPLVIAQGGSAWLFSTKGKIVEHVSEEVAERYLPVSGCELLAPAVGTRIAFAVEQEERLESLLALIAVLEETGMLEQTDAIRLDDPESLYMDYAGRFTVKLPYGADYAYKMKALRAALADDKIQDNMTGTFDMQLDESRIFFQQNVR